MSSFSSQRSFSKANDVNRVALQIGNDAYTKSILWVNQMWIRFATNRLAKCLGNASNELLLITLRQKYLEAVRVLGVTPIGAHGRNCVRNVHSAAISRQLIHHKLHKIAGLALVGHSTIGHGMGPLKTLESQERRNHCENQNPNDNAL